MVQSHIKSLLYAYDCVIIPDFGGLITHYAPAKIHQVKHTFSPPYKRVAFNEQLKVNDGLLISTLAHKQQWPLPKAQQTVAAFVQELKEQLLTQHRFELKDVGVFRYNAERKLVFESLDQENFLEHSFGLPELVSKPIPGKESLVLRGNFKDQTASQEGNKKSSRFRKLYRMGATLVLGGVAITGIYLLSLQSDVALSSLNPFSLITSSTSAPATTPAQEVETDPFEQAQLTEQFKSALPQETTVENELAADDSLLAQFPENGLKTAEAPVALAETPIVEEVAPVASPAKKEKEVTVPAVKTEVKKEAAPEKAKAATSAASTIKHKTGRFYVIMGVFSLDGYAVSNQKRLQKKGFDAKIIVSAYDTKRERVSVADFASEAEAYAALPALRSKISNELWVYNY
ncbi:HU domain-containing protein [Rufibacter soli]